MTMLLNKVDAQLDGKKEQKDNDKSKKIQEDLLLSMVIKK
jgi:hypothetical protein